MLRSLADGLLGVLLAPTCAACDTPVDEPTRGPVCAACWRAIAPFTPPLCSRCGDPLPSWRTISIEVRACPRCRRRRSDIVLSRAIGEYDGALRSIVHALKYGRRRTVAPRLATLMREFGSESLAGADAVVPVPLHSSRKRSRGFNQADVLARHLELPLLHALRRIRATSSQTDLPAARRHANVRNAFALARRIDVRGRTLVLVDDVCTTGATLEACARALRQAGAREVRALTAARVGCRRP